MPFEYPSRRTFLMLGSTALVGGATSAFGLTEKGRSSAQTSAQVSSIVPYQIDPVTAAAAVKTGLDIAIKMKSLFGNKAKGGDTKLLKQIVAQNAQIIRMLEQVLSILSNMGVIVRAGVRAELLTALKNTLSVKFKLFYETWDAESVDRRSRTRRQAKDTYRDLLVPIAELARQIATPELYGFAHFQMVGHAMLVEMWISNRIGRSESFRRQAARTYEDYFDAVLDQRNTGSVENQLNAARDQMARMNRILVEADKYVSGNPSEIVQRRKVIASKGLSTTYADVERRISGNREIGYKSHDRNINIKVERENADVRGDRPGGIGGRQSIIGPIQNVSKPLGENSTVELDPDPVFSGDLSIGNRTNYWNSVRNVYGKAREEAATLAVSKETAEIFRSVAHEIAEG